MADVYSILSEAREAVKAVSTLDDRMKLAQAIDMVSELQSENDRLRSRVRELEGELAAVKKLECKQGTYYILEDDGHRTGPVCPNCYKHDGIVVILERSDNGGYCPCCQSRYPGVKASVDAPRQEASY